MTNCNENILGVPREQMWNVPAGTLEILLLISNGVRHNPVTAEKSPVEGKGSSMSTTN